MVRPALLVVFLLLSCASPAYLVTDVPFRRAFPEVDAAWKALPFWSGARQADLGAEGGTLSRVLATLPADAAVLVGAAVSDTERTAAGPRVRFFGPPRAGSPALTVRRAEAWALVAAGAAAPGARGWILFPADSSEEERREAAGAWTRVAGSPAEQAVWPSAGTVAPPPAVLLDFAGPEADPLLLGAAAGRPVHGDPGLPAVPGTSPVVWNLRKEGLGDTLLAAARNSAENVEFLPVETARPRR